MDVYLVVILAGVVVVLFILDRREIERASRRAVIAIAVTVAAAASGMRKACRGR
jgi:hypothetical protein